MARKTDGEKIDEIIPVVAALQESVGNVRKELKDLPAVAVLQERLDNVREELKELKKDLEESRRRLWLIVPPLLAALATAAITAVVNYLSRR